MATASYHQNLAIDLFCGLGGWAEGFLAEGYSVVGFDIERRPYPGQLVLQDVLTLHGSQFRDAAVIVASPPCQAYSYRAMPWKRAKALPPPSNELFDACFRIQREASEAAGRHIPMVVENVNGAQPWVGLAKWHYGSYYLWGDVPALMPIVGAFKVPGFRFDGNGGSFQTASVGSARMKSNAGTHDRTEGPGRPRFIRESDAVKQPGISGLRNNGKGDGWFQDGAAKHGSKSSARKHASALIAKIPFPLAQHIARTYRPC